VTAKPGQLAALGRLLAAAQKRQPAYQVRRGVCTDLNGVFWLRLETGGDLPLVSQVAWTCPGFVETLRLEATASERSSRCRGADPLTPREFREEAVRLVRSSGRPIAQIARELGIAHGTLSAWVKQAELDAGLRSDGLTTAEREELRRLRRENRILREEREILKKAAAFFARETESKP
jgi:transposase